MEGGIDKGGSSRKTGLSAKGQMVLELMWELFGKVTIYNFLKHLEDTIILRAHTKYL